MLSETDNVSRFSLDNFHKRIERFRIISSRLPVTKTFPMLAEIKIDETLFQMLACALRLYIFSSFHAAYQEKIFDSSDDFLHVKRNKIMALPNITPNGQITAKKENAVEFNLVQRTVAEIFRSFKIDEHVETVHMPVGIRLVDGVSDSVKDARPYASVKIHTDVWNGDPIRSLVLFIPVLGDIGSTSIEFYEPDERLMKKFLGTLPDYSDGKPAYENAKKYECALRPGFVYMADSLLLHRTVKDGGGLRISVNFRFVPQKKVLGETEKETHKQVNWKRNYVPLYEWYSVLDKNFIVPQESFQDAIRAYVKRGVGSSSSPIDYKDYYKLIPLDA